MKCHECNGRGNYYNGKTRLACPFCNGTGEVVGNSEQLKSRSVQREAKPTVKKSLTVEDKPVILPPGDPGRCSDCGCDLDKPAGEDCNVRHEDKPKMPGQITSEFGELNAKFIQEAERMLVRCKELQIHLDCANQLLKTQREEYDKLKANHLPADKVRELARFAEACWQQLDGLLARGSSDIDYDDEIKMRDEKLDWRESLGLLDALFPEGVEEK